MTKRVGLGKNFNGCRFPPLIVWTPPPQLRDNFICRKAKNQSNNSDDYNHNDNEMVEIITVCYLVSSAYNSISEKKNLDKLIEME